MHFICQNVFIQTVKNIEESGEKMHLSDAISYSKQCTWNSVLLNRLKTRVLTSERVERGQNHSTFKRPDSTTAKFFARNCLCEIRMVGHE